jgi:xanthine dehydrogenase accessory factor
MNIFKEIVKLQEENLSFAIVTIIKSKGSTPRHVGKMVVKEDGSIIGTIGGGPSEKYTIGKAIEAIKNNKSEIIECMLNGDMEGGFKVYCGGSITLFIEVIKKRPNLVIIGAGHVGLALARIAEGMDYNITIVDDREGYADEIMYPMAKNILIDLNIAKAIKKITFDLNTYVVIVTKDVDESALREVIKNDTHYIGMIGSKNKGIKIKEHLMSEGISKEKLDLVSVPIGLDIGAETPEEIAVSIMAEILKVKNNASGNFLKDKM